MKSEVLGRFDALIGNGVEAAVCAKHRLRLRRLGQAHALRPGPGEWAQAHFPPRPGCHVEVLIDGARALPAIAEAISEAEQFVHITGWDLAAGFELVRDETRVVLGELLAEMAQKVDVRVLVWAGAPVPLFHPTRSEVAEGVRRLTRETRIRCEPDPREHPFHCHHEKTVVVDGKVAFVGGIDFTDDGGDRFDSSRHPARRKLGWHDVATRLHGPVVADVAAHFALRWEELTSERAPTPAPPDPAGGHTVQLVRTIAEGMYDHVPRGEFSVLESYVRALRGAQRLIYLENQFLWSTEIVSILAEKLRRPPHPDFRLVVLLPAKPNNGRDDTLGQLGVLADAAGDSQRLLAATICSRSGERTDPLYVHAKVGIVDDRWLTVGSANLNSHSLLNDSECNIVCDDPDLARDTRVRLWAEHLEMSVEEVADADPCRLVTERWQPIAREQLARMRDGRPATHRLSELPGVSRRSGRLLGPLQSLVDDG